MTLIRHDGRRGSTWAFRFWSRGRLHQGKGFPTAGLAKEAERRARGRAAEQAFEAAWGPLQPRLTPWADVVARYLEAKAHKRSLAKDRAELAWWGTFFARRQCHYLQAVTPDLVDAGARELGRGRTPQTVHHYLAVLRHLSQLAIRRWQLIDRNPTLALDWPRITRVPRRVPTPAERDALRRAADPLVAGLITVISYTGLRPGAILRLTAEDFRGRPGWLRCPNTKASRIFWLPVAPPLATWFQGLGVLSGPLWRKADGSVVRWFPRKAWVRCRIRAGLEGLEFYGLRHLVATTLTEGGVPLRVVQRVLDHSSARVTERYTEPTDPALVHAIQLLAERFR